MQSKIDLFFSLNNIEKMEFGIDTCRIRNEANKFYNNIILRDYHIYTPNRLQRGLSAMDCLLIAKSCVQKLVNLIISLFEMGESEYIKNLDKSREMVQEFKSHIQLSMGRLDSFRKEVKTQDWVNSLGKPTQIIDVSSIEEYKQMIIQFMEGFVIYPIKEAFRKFNEVEKDIVKDKDLFYWFLFKELYSVAVVEGGTERQLSKGIQTLNLHEKNFIGKKYPDNVRRIQEEETGEINKDYGKSVEEMLDSEEEEDEFMESN